MGANSDMDLFGMKLISAGSILTENVDSGLPAVLPSKPMRDWKGMLGVVTGPPTIKLNAFRPPGRSSSSMEAVTSLGMVARYRKPIPWA